MDFARSYCFIFLFFASKLLYGQSPSFKHFSNREGLVQSPISNILQDRTGFIWLATKKGLVRHDGYEFKAFHPVSGDSTSISNNRVNFIFQDSKDRLWIGTSNGLNLYSPILGTFKRIDILDIKGGRNYISCIAEDRQNNIWIGTFDGLKKLNTKTLKLEDIYGRLASPKFKNSPVFSILVDKENIIWSGTGAGLMKFDPLRQSNLPLPKEFERYKDFFENRILVIKQDLNQDLYFGTEISGAFLFSKNTGTVKNYLYQQDKNGIASNFVRDILINNNEQIWFATRDGISVLNKKTQSFISYRHDPLDEASLNDNAVWSLLLDRNNCIWAGTFAAGLNFYHNGGSNFQNIGEKGARPMGLNHKGASSVTAEANGALWVGTASGLNYIDRKANLSTSYSFLNRNNAQPVNGVKSLADDGRGNLWVGTLNGVGIFNKKMGRLSYVDLGSPGGKLSENLVTAILADGQGAWVGTNGGGLRYILPNGNSTVLLVKDPKNEKSNKSAKINNQHIPILQSNALALLTDNYITALLKTEKDQLWIGTQNGLNLYDTKANRLIKAYQKIGERKFQLSKSNISALFTDSKNRLWVGTEDGGLNFFHAPSQRFYAIDDKHGLNDNVVHAVVEDENNNLWISTDLGLAEIKIKKFGLPFQKKDLEITSYTTDDGLVSNQFSNKAGLRLSSGEIVFGGINGLTIFHPQQITKNTTPPPVVITELSVNYSSLEKTANGLQLFDTAPKAGELELKHDQSNLNIKFAALNYINPSSNTYAYKLLGPGLQDNWQAIGNQRVVNFTNLRPGHYVFSVMGANNDGVWSKEARTLRIHIYPPFWLSWWAYVIYLLLAGAATYTVLNFIRNRQRLKRELYLEHAQNERINELYAMKLDFFTNISHEIRTPLTLILGPIEKLIGEHANADFSKTLHLIKGNADRLMKLVNELLDFRKAEEGHLKIYCSLQDIVPFCQQIYSSFESLSLSKSINYVFAAPSEPMMVYFDGNQLEKVIFNLLANAFKFTPNGGEITLAVAYAVNNGQWIEITVTDNGQGIPDDFKDKLFESFYQANEEDGQHIGSGIGLAMARNIVELHKGTIKAISGERPKENQTKFIVSLQRGKAHFSPSQILSEPAHNRINVTTSLAIQDQFITSSDHFGDKRYKVMVVEDNPEVRKLITDTLESGYQLVACADGQLALDMMELEIPDLIVSDIMMPRVDGIELCHKVKSNEATNHIPFILLTAKASVAHQLQGLSIGADAYLSKPFSLQLLQLNIRNLLRAQEVVRAKFCKNIFISPIGINAVTPEEKFIGRLMEIIERRFSDASFDVLDLVQEIGMSRSVLYKKVQVLTGYAVADLIKEVRLKRAAELLKDTSFNINEITYMVGFNNRKHFSTEFKKKHGLTPSEFLKSNKTKE